MYCKDFCGDDIVTRGYYYRALVRDAVAIAGTMTALSKRIGISRPTLYALHTGEGKPTMATIAKLERFVKRGGRVKDATAS